jgi:hypothetical protein
MIRINEVDHYIREGLAADRLNDVVKDAQVKIIPIVLVIVILFSTIAPNVMALKGYWTTNDTDPGPGLKKYHVFLDGIYPSYVGRNIRLLNQNLSACLDFASNNISAEKVNDTESNPFLCHRIKESDIPKANDRRRLFRSVI